MPVTFINLFTVPAGREEEFLARWQEVNEHMRRKPGYVAHRLHRSLRPDAAYRFVNVATWASAEDWQAAHDEGFRALVSRPEWADFSSTPALFELVHEGAA